jgi:uncharacterized protein YqgV (UPF0045/DUF77 family)
MTIKVIQGVVSSDANNQIANELDGKSTLIQVEINDYDEFVDNISEFVQEELEDNGVYEFDEFDETTSMIQIGDDADDNTFEEITNNFKEVVEKVINFLNKEGLSIKSIINN